MRTKRFRSAIHHLYQFPQALFPDPKALPGLQVQKETMDVQERMDHLESQGLQDGPEYKALKEKLAQLDDLDETAKTDLEEKEAREVRKAQRVNQAFQEEEAHQVLRAHRVRQVQTVHRASQRKR